MVFGSFAPSLIIFRGVLIQDIISAGHKVIACAPEIDQNTAAWLLEAGVASHSIPLQRTGLNPCKDYYTVTILKKLLLLERPDVILSYTVKPVIYGSLSAFWAGVPNIYSMITGLGYAFSGNTLRRKIIGKIAQTLYRIALKKNNKVFFQNPDDRDEFVKLRLVKKRQSILINGSGVDLDHYQATPLPTKKAFLLISRLIKEKGIHEYVEAARIIKDQYDEVTFTLVGWIDPTPSAINPKDLQKWQHDGLIEFKGKMEDVRPALTDTLVYVLPSYREGTPRTVLEAMAMGRAIVTTDVPGCRETVRDGINGYLVPPNDSVALAKALEKFILRPELAIEMGRKSRQMAYRFDVHKVNNVILRTMGLIP